jgi:putative tricarboxylic transport membrane protein
MTEIFSDALSAVVQPEHLLFVLLGAVLGLVVGLLPGLGGAVGLAILLPFVYGMDPYTGTGLLVGMMATTNTGDTFPAILAGIPGTSASQATIMDGYPMARQGRAATALAAAFTASAVGGVIGAIALGGLLFAARPLVLALGSPELFMLVALGLAMVCVLSRGAPIAGITAGLVGMLLGTIGSAPAALEYRFTFDSLYLAAGIPLAVMALGLFAVPEVIDLLAGRKSIAKAAKLEGSRKQGIVAVWKNRWLVFRSSMIGLFIGILPGLGGSAGQWISYGAAKQTSPGAKDSFGKGDVRGLIAPESANNADNGGSLVPALAFGIPGNGSTAIFIAGFTLLGLQAGPAMVQGEGLSISLSLVWSLVVASIVGTLICFVLAGPVARLTLVPARRLMPVVLVIIILAAYQTAQSWVDLAFVFGIGVMAWVMKQVGWPRPPLLIGFVLAAPAERYLSISINRFGADWLLRPGVLILAAVIVLTVYSVVRRRRSPGSVLAR